MLDGKLHLAPPGYRQGREIALLQAMVTARPGVRLSDKADYQGKSILRDNFNPLSCDDAARESSSGVSC